MFEDFSFPSPRGDHGLTANYNEDMVVDCDSNLVSPLSSRCPSPVPFRRNSKDHPLFPRGSRSPFRLAPAPTSIPYNYSDKRLSIGTLTKKLDAQSLENDTGSDSDDGPNFPVTPPRSAHTHMPSIWLENEPLSPPYTERDETSSWTGPSPTSTPIFAQSRSPSFSGPNNLPYSPRNASLTPQDHEQASSLRQTRENLSLLQCTAKTVAETVRIALMIEENDRLCLNSEVDDDRHPSSLPPPPVSRKRAPFNQSQKSLNRSFTEPVLKSKLSTGASTKIEKPRQSPSHNGGFRRGGRSPQGLRRRSLVLAAVTAMMEAEAAEKERTDRDTDSPIDNSRAERAGNSLDPLDVRLRRPSTPSVSQ